MKKLLLVLVLIGLAVPSMAETIKMYSTDFAYCVKNNNGDWSDWSDWSDWEPSHCLIVINTDRDVINIYSREPQEFDVISSGRPDTDREGGKILTFKCVDKEGLRCDIRLRVQKDGQKQLYVDYNDIMYVYCMEIK